MIQIPMHKILPILSYTQLCDQLKLDPHQLELRTLFGMDEGLFSSLVLEPLRNYAEIVQLAPASEAHHHSGPGGLLKHTLDVLVLALKKRRGYQLPLGGSINDIQFQKHLWTYAIFAGCLLHDIGKLAANIRLIGIREDQSEFTWTPQSGPWTNFTSEEYYKALLKQDKKRKISKTLGYRIEFRKTPYHYHDRLSLTHWHLLSHYGRTWLFEASHIMQELTAWLWGDRFESGTIGEIVEYADRESTAKNLQLPSEARFSNTIPAIERYVKLIRHWIEGNSIKLNANGGMGWVDTHGNLYLLCRSLAEKLIQECNSQGLRNLPQDPVRIYDILQEHGYALPTEDGKAIWNIRVITPQYTHEKFTCLKFEARKFTTPTRTLSPLEGNIEILGDVVNETIFTQIEKSTALKSSNTERNTMESALEHASVESNQDSIYETVEKISTHEIESTEIAQEPVDNSHSTHKGSITQEFSNVTTEAINLIRNLEVDGSDTGKKFFSWLQRGLFEKTIILNSITAEVHIVEEGVFLLAPAIFKTFLRLHGADENKHNNLSKKFARLRIHIRNGDLNIHSYWVKSSNRASAIKGWLVPFNQIYPEESMVPKPNKYIQKELS